MSSDTVIKVENLCKCYQIYEQPLDRLKQFFLPRLQTIAGWTAQRYYREFWALRGVSFEIGKGETVGIVGRNGSGKSTLLQMICGTVKPTQGLLETRGRVAALLELGAGFNPEFTGRENVLLNAGILGISQDVMFDRMNDVLTFSELGDFLEQPVKTYSSGMYSRLAFSIAIHVNPDILIVDEALAVGDARFVAKCMRRIKEIQDQGTTILFVSHDVGSVRTLCERAIWLDKGRMIEQGEVFPVTGRFMEFMFKDEKSEEEELRETICSIDSDALAVVAPNNDQDRIVSSDHADLLALGAPAIPSPPLSLDARPVTHWGSHKGMILSAHLRDENGLQKDVFGWGVPIQVMIEVRVPQEISRDSLSIAFSIKDLKGTDLIVSTTHDFSGKTLPDTERFSVMFSLVNPLTTGKYLLVAAVENRQYRDIHYYEYVEGAHYFATLASERFFGLFQPPIEQHIQIPS